MEDAYKIVITFIAVSGVGALGNVVLSWKQVALAE